MSRAIYVESHLPGESNIDPMRVVARAHLDLAHLLADRRETLGYTLAEAADRSGIPAERLSEIEEGDTSSLTEVLCLCAALRFGFSVDERLGVRPGVENSDGPSVAADAAVGANPVRRAG